MIIILNNDSCCNFETLKCSLIIHYAKKKNKIYVKNRNSITCTEIHNYRTFSVFLLEVR